MGLMLIGCGGSNQKSESQQIIEETVVVEQNAVFEVTVTSNWRQNTFPTNYPSNAHYSPVTGLTHNGQARLFQIDELASEGIIDMAETGRTSVLQDEISTIQNLGGSNYMITESGISINDNQVTFTFEASIDFPLLSLVSMIAPSPDWFIGVDSLPLFENETWLDEIKLELSVYDAGSDSGMQFNSINNETDPRQTIRLLTSERTSTDFLDGVHFENQVPVATLDIKRLN